MSASEPGDDRADEDANVQRVPPEAQGTPPAPPPTELTRDPAGLLARAARILWFWPVAAIGLVAVAGAFGDWRAVAGTTVGLAALAASSVAAATRSHAVAIAGFLVAAALLGFVLLRVDAKGDVALLRPSESVAVLVAAKEIPRFHVLEDADLTLGIRPTQDKGRYSRYPVAGRMTTRRVAKGAALSNDDLLPGPTRFRGAVVTTGFELTRAATLNGLLRRGDPVDLLLTVPRSRGPVRVPAVVVSVSANVSTAPRTDSLVVAVDKDVADRRAQALAAGAVSAIQHHSP